MSIGARGPVNARSGHSMNRAKLSNSAALTLYSSDDCARAGIPTAHTIVATPRTREKERGLGLLISFRTSPSPRLRVETAAVARCRQRTRHGVHAAAHAPSPTTRGDRW